jgi:hypothetical protein
MQQPHPQAGFQLPDGLAKSRWRDLQYSGSRSETAVFGHFPERHQAVELLQLHALKFTFIRLAALAAFSL